jgi:peroxiredoxin
MNTLFQRFALPALAVVLLLSGWMLYVRATKPTLESGASDSSSLPQEHHHATSEDHKKCAARLAGKPLPPLPLRGVDNQVVNVIQASMERPVIVVRYLGYSCSHCIQQLLMLKEHTQALRASGVRVIAFSEDSRDDNEMVIKKYGFDPTVFIFASDAGNFAAKELGGVYKENDGSETELHITLIVRQGVVTFAHFDTKPMMDIILLLQSASVAPLREAL